MFLFGNYQLPNGDIAPGGSCDMRFARDMCYARDMPCGARGAISYRNGNIISHLL